MFCALLGLLTTHVTAEQNPCRREIRPGVVMQEQGTPDLLPHKLSYVSLRDILGVDAYHPIASPALQH